MKLGFPVDPKEEQYFSNQESSLALTINLRICRSHLMRNLPNLLYQYNKCQTRAQKIEKCPDESLELTYHFSIFTSYHE